MDRNELSKLILKKNNMLSNLSQKHEKENEKVQCLKNELDRLVYEYYKTISCQ